MLRKVKFLLIPLFVLIAVGEVLGQGNQIMDPSLEAGIRHDFYFLGNSGIGDPRQLDEVMGGLYNKAEQCPGTVVFLGNSVPFKSKLKKRSAKVNIPTANILKQAKGLFQKDFNVHYLPGVSEWSFGLKGLRHLQHELEQELSKKDIFLPRNGCPIEKRKVNKKVHLLLIDSYWAMMNWDTMPGINAGCDIQSREDFYIEIEDEIVKSQGKTLIIAMHHPLVSLGPLGNPRGFGLNPSSLNDPDYRYFRERVGTIAQQWPNVIFVAAHEQSLQLQFVDQSPMLVSGSASQITKVRKSKKDEDFALAAPGFIRISVYGNGSVWAEFFAKDNGFTKPIFKQEIQPAPKKRAMISKIFSDSLVRASIYSHKPLSNNTINRALFGANYMGDYITSVGVRAVNLDTLKGGLKVIRKGGGHQTQSLRLKDPQGRQYTLRSLEKSALRFVQHFIYKTHYLSPEYQETYLLRVLQEYWTTANPYGVLTIGELSDALAILHPSPSLYFVPSQPALGKFNEGFGNRLYYFEEHLSDGHGDEEKLGFSDEIISSFKLLEKLHNRNRATIDKSLYIRNRIFDNLIGDWDRHADQWRWARFKKADGLEYYRPIPRDRDQAYSNFDGIFLRTLTLLAPPLRFMQRYGSDYKHIKWFNDAGDDLDLAVLDDHNLEDWLREARFIKQHLTDTVISRAFDKLPKEVDETRKEKVELTLKARLEKVESLAVELYKNLSRNILVAGTEGADTFTIVRNPDGSVFIEGNITGEKGREPFWQQTYDPKVTREIWIYGLEGEDRFEISGLGKGNIFLRIIGGHGQDYYKAINKRGVRIYDYHSEPNSIQGSIRRKLSDRYDLNTYHYKKHPRTIGFASPILAYERDNELTLGFRYSATYRSMYREPFTYQHKLSARYFSGTTGAALEYSGEFAEVLSKINFGIDARYSSPNHVLNFFGFGNQSSNFESQFGVEYNQVRIQRVGLEPKLLWRGYKNSKLSLSATYDYYEVERSPGRFISSGIISEELFEGSHFLGAAATYYYENFDSALQPRLGLGYGITAGFTVNPDTKLGYSYLMPELRITNKVDLNGRLVLATKIKGQLIGNDHFAFYQAVTLGGMQGLRGFRQQRFAGKNAFYQTTDLRIGLGQMNKGILPAAITIYGGFDYGRVWHPEERSNLWHTSYGGGVYINLMGFLTGNTAYFGSPEGGRLVLGLSVPF